MSKLGGSVIPINDVTYSSVSKGETLEDTILTLACYSDVIVLRHPDKGAAAKAAMVSPVPIINAGDGTGEHPTQALLDLYTMMEHLGQDKVEAGYPFHIALMGDLKHGRTVHSLVRLIRHYPALQISLIGPPELGMPESLLQPQDTVHETLDEVIGKIDVLYVTRVQKERIKNNVTVSYRLTPEHMKRARSDMIVMHPLPRVDEIDRNIDSDPRAIWFHQVRNGLMVRQAVLASLLAPDTAGFPSWSDNKSSLC